jgi:2'-hydroxyisoflavone reductase
MKVLVIGGTQFIGRLLVAALLKSKHEVTVLHRRRRHSLSKSVQNLAADRNDADAMRRVLAGKRFQAVFDNVYDMERGTTGAQIEATALACGDHLERYVFTSSVAAYGDGLNHVEDNPLAADAHPNVYARNKAMSERALFRLHHSTGFPLVTFRPPFVYGPHNQWYREAFFWDRIRSKRPVIIPGDGTRLMQFVFVGDLVGAMVSSLTVEAAVGQAFNIGHPRAVTQVEFVRELGRAAGKEPTLVHVAREKIVEAAAAPGKQQLYFGQFFDVPPITEKIAKVHRVLGVRPTAFATSLAETYRWYLRQPKRKADFRFEDGLLRSTTTTV